MSTEKLATKSDLQEMYSRILPYLGGSADAGFTPVGTIISVMGVNAPANYLKCDGTVYNISDYPELSNYFYQQFGSKNKFGGNGTTTFAVPNLNGQFLRGTGTNSDSTQGSGSAVGTRQKATRHSSPKAYGYSGGKVRFFYELPSNPSTESWANRAYDVDKSLTATPRYTYAPAQTTTTVYASGTEEYAYTSRPTNTSVLFCIATKNIYLNPSMDYSTDEKVVGTWIDGKTIWQKTFITTFGEINVAKEIELDISAETIVSIDGMYSSIPTTVTYWNPFNSFSSNMQYANKIWVSTGQQTKLFVYTGHSDRVGENVVVTIRYTKTTS